MGIHSQQEGEQEGDPCLRNKSNNSSGEQGGFDSVVNYQRSGIRKWQNYFLGLGGFLTNKHPVIIANVTECLLDRKHCARGFIWSISFHPHK